MRQQVHYAALAFRSVLCAQICLCMSQVSFAHKDDGGPARTGRTAAAQVGRSGQENDKSRLPLGLAAADLGHFESAMQRISATAHVAIVAEGVPLRHELTKDETNELLKDLSANSDATVAANLTLVAHAYDYDIERAGDSGFILRKHFSDPTDLPDVTYDEVTRSLASLLQLIDGDRSSPAVTAVDPASFLLYDSLSESQKAMATGDKGLTLTLADLGPEQKKYAMELAQNITVDSKTSAIRRCLQHLTAIRGKDPYFRWTARPTGMSFAYHGPPRLNPRPPTVFDTPFFVYGFPTGRTNYLTEFPLNHRFKINIDGGGAQPPASRIAELCAIRPEQLADAGLAGRATDSSVVGDTVPATSIINGVYDPTVPTAQDRRLAPGMMSDKLVSTVTLTELAVEFSSKRPGQRTSSGLHITVDPALDGKPVSVYGRDCIPGDVLIRLAARVYGLRISTADNKSIYVTTPNVRPVHSTSDLQSEIRRLIPPSLLQSLESQIDRIAAPALQNTHLPSHGTAEQNRAFLEKLERDRRNGGAAIADGCWYFPADRRLIVLGTAAVPAPASPPVSIASLGPEPSRLIALMALTDGSLFQMRGLLGFEPPLCLADPSALQIVVRCGQHGNGQGIGFHIRSVESTGVSKYEGGSAFMRHTDMIPWPTRLQPKN